MRVNSYDSITGEAIQHGQAVRAFLLVNDWLNNPSGEALMPHMSQKDYKLTAFPVQGTWDADLHLVVPTNKKDVANEKILFDVFRNESFVEVQSAINSGQVFSHHDGSKKEFGLMIISEATFESIAEIPRVKMFCSSYEPERFISEFNDVVESYINAPELSDRHLEMMEGIFGFNCRSRSFFGELDLNVPFGSNLELSESRSVFSKDMKRSMFENRYFGSGLTSYLTQYGSKPEGLDEYLRSVYESNYIGEAFSALTRNFRPSICYSGAINPETNAELLISVVKRELQSAIGYQFEMIKQGRSVSIDEIDNLIDSMKKDLVELVRERNDLAKQSGLTQNPNGLQP